MNDERQFPDGGYAANIEKIEILPVSILDEQDMTVKALRQLASSGGKHSLKLEFGWHYLLDLTWIIANLEKHFSSDLLTAGRLNGKKILDAGAGTGVMQWYLADHGVETISADRVSRANLPFRFRNRFHVTGLRQGSGVAPYRAPPDLNPPARMLLTNLSHPRWVLAQVSEAFTSRGGLSAQQSSGKVVIYNQDLKYMPDIPDETLDAVVSVSALEHNPPDKLGEVVAELMRVIKPGGVLLATLCASAGEDWYHQPSSGWCYSEASLQRAFQLASGTPSNYTRYSETMQALQDCAELRDNLAAFYSQSGDNGMPWGKWDPQYQPVGICKIK